MEEMAKHGRIGKAAMKADMDRKTAKKYTAAGKLPSQLKKAHSWRTREDPFSEHWPEVEALLGDAPGLQAQTLLEDLMGKYPEQYHVGQLRTLQRRVRQWKADKGPEQEVMLAQKHRPGEAAQSDFTNANELGVTIAGVDFPHMFHNFVLPYSNWTCATVCHSESMAAMKKGVQRSLLFLGKVPIFHQTDNSTSATHRIQKGDAEKSHGRTFNKDYLALMAHFSMTPRTTAVGAKEQNGDIEAQNRVLKQRLEQALLLRGRRDFDDVDAWQAFVDEVNRKANTARCARVEPELAAMKELDAKLLVEFVELDCRVTSNSTIRVKENAYSVPSRLIGHKLRVRLFEDRIEAYLGAALQLACPRLLGQKRHRIDYRHVIHSLVKKPGGFARYVYREDMFPSLVFRKAYDTIQSEQCGTKGDKEYLRILYLAARSMQSDVELALSLMLEEKERITVDLVKAMVVVDTPTIPKLQRPDVDLSQYNALLEENV